MSDKHISLKEALEIERAIFEDLEKRRNDAREAESKYWKFLNEDGNYSELPNRSIEDGDA